MSYIYIDASDKRYETSGYGQLPTVIKPNPDADPNFDLARVLPAKGTNSPIRIMDLGCGNGNGQIIMLNALATVISYPVEVCGIDLNTQELQAYYRLRPHLDFNLTCVAGDITSIPFRADTFYGGTSSCALHWLGSKAMFTRGLEEIHRTLQVRGVMDIIIPSPFNPMNYGEWTERKENVIVDFENGTGQIMDRINKSGGIHSFDWRGKPVTTLTTTALMRLCENAGFERIRSKEVKTKSDFKNPLALKHDDIYEFSWVIIRKS